MDLVAQVLEAGWAQVWYTVVFSVIEVQVPVCRIVFVGSLQVKGVDLEINWEHSLRIEVDYVVAWWFTFECRDRTGDVVHTNSLSVLYVIHDLEELMVDVRKNSKSNDMLESVDDCVVSSSVLSGALVQSWDVREDDRESLLLLDLSELLDQPLELITRVIEGSPSVEVGIIADVRIK